MDFRSRWSNRDRRSLLKNDSLREERPGVKRAFYAGPSPSTQRSVVGTTPGRQRIPESAIVHPPDLRHRRRLTGAAGVQRQNLAGRELWPDGRAVGGRVIRSSKRRYMRELLVLQDLLVVVEPVRQHLARQYRRERPRPDVPRSRRNARVRR